jgi:hypothetical protein
MCILLQFPSPDDPRPEPPAPSMCLPRPVEPAVTDAVSVFVPRASAEHACSAFCIPRGVARDRVAHIPTYRHHLYQLAVVQRLFGIECAISSTLVWVGLTRQRGHGS